MFCTFFFVFLLTINSFHCLRPVWKKGGMSSSTGSREVFETSRARARRVAGSTILRSRPSSVEGTSTDQSPSLYHASTVRRPHSEPSKQQQQQRSLTQTDSARNKSGGGGAVKEGAPPRPRRKKKPILYQPRKSVRPSLSEQLAAIGSSAETINKSICSKFGLAAPAAPLLRTPAKTFVVGKLTAKIPGPVAFFKDRCTFVVALALVHRLVLSF